MKNYLNRSYRKNLNCIGVLSFDSAEYAFLAMNISTTGILAKLLNEKNADKFKSVSTASPGPAHLELPEMSFSCICEIIRVEKRDGALLLALKFDEESLNVDVTFENPHLENKHLATVGEFIVGSNNYPCKAVYLANTSLIVTSNQHVSLKLGQDGVFKPSTDMAESINAKILWVETPDESVSIIGLELLDTISS